MQYDQWCDMTLTSGAISAFIALVVILHSLYGWAYPRQRRPVTRGSRWGWAPNGTRPRLLGSPSTAGGWCAYCRAATTQSVSRTRRMNSSRRCERRQVGRSSRTLGTWGQTFLGSSQNCCRVWRGRSQESQIKQPNRVERRGSPWWELGRDS